MSGTIEYGENGAVEDNPALDQIREQKQAIQDAQGQDVYSEEGSSQVEDPTAMTGTLETSGTSGSTSGSADEVSAVFDEANPSGVPEGSIAAGVADPAAEGENINPESGVENIGGAETSAKADLTDNTNAGGPEGTEQAQETSQATSADSDFDASKDPADYKVAEVMAFLKGASDEDVKKVQAAEKKGQGRKTIADFSK